MSTPHINMGTFGRKPPAVLTAACSLAASAGSPLGATSFSSLSEQAQDLSVLLEVGTVALRMTAKERGCSLGTPTALALSREGAARDSAGTTDIDER